MTLTNARVLIQGGGIAGTALAYWLHRAGARPTVVERAGELTADLSGGFAAYERRMREFVRRNQALGPANVKRMVLRTKGQVRMSMAMLSVMAGCPAATGC